MALIYVSSATPGEEVARISDPIVSRVESVSPAPRQLQVNWLKVGHAIGYGLLGLAFRHAFAPHGGRAVWMALIATAAYAGFDELHQSFVPGRSGSTLDMAIDTLAAAAAIAARSLAVWLGKRYDVLVHLAPLRSHKSSVQPKSRFKIEVVGRLVVLCFGGQADVLQAPL